MGEEGRMESGQIAAWTPGVEELLRNWHSRVYAAQSAYYDMAERLRRWNYRLGIPVVIFSSMVGTAIFADWSRNGIYKLLAGSISIGAAVLAGLQTFLKFGENATLHGSAGDWYSAIRREIEQLLALPPALRGNPKDCLDSIRQEMNKAGQKSPELDEKLWKRVAGDFGVNEPLPGARHKPDKSGGSSAAGRTSGAA